MEQEKKKLNWQIVNFIILVLNTIFPIWLFALMYTAAISFTAFLIAVSVSLLLGVIYKLVRKYHKGKGFLYAARAIAVGAWIIFYLPTLILFSFPRNKLLYPLKRFDYMYGVYGSDYYKEWLPEKLPEVCDDYLFITKGSVLAQDYHASSYLMFHTDTETLDSYARHFDNLDGIRYENGTEDEDIQRIEWFCNMLSLTKRFPDSLDHAVLYWFSDSRYPKGVLLNYATGLIAIMT